MLTTFEHNSSTRAMGGGKKRLDQKEFFKLKNPPRHDKVN